MPVIETINLTKDYAVGFWRKRPRRVLDDLNLAVESGEVFGLLGPNGAGKSTTLKLILRLIFPTRGTISIFGADWSDASLRARIGFLPENPSFYDNLTAEEFLKYAGSLFGLAPGERRRRAAQLLEQVGLAEVADIPVRRYSKGMVQRLGIAQALVNDPDLVILDEPMSGLDPLGRREVRDLILELKAARKTVVFSTHILPDAETLCDRVAILHRGRLQGLGELSRILAMGIASTEIVLENVAGGVLNALATAGIAAVRTGDRVRLSVQDEAEVGKVLEIAVREKIKLVSMTPVRMTLEDYFLEKVEKGQPVRERFDRQELSRGN
ncbi:MAG: ABC transporter [Acidobacteria bacterium]|nr:MAG: ABC transporter [Acidobacteriota bacterium]